MQYADITIIDEKGSQLVMGMLFSFLHGAIKTHGVALQAGFPDWVNPLCPKIGRTLRLFGADEDVDFFLNNDEIGGLAVAGIIRVGVIHDVPETSGKYVRFTRERSVQNRSGKGIARNKRNSERRGHQDAHTGGYLKLADASPHIWFKMKSASNGNDYLLRVRRDVVDRHASPSGGHGYGLGMVLPVF